MIRKKPTIKDIAKIAVVSSTTVFMALNDRPRIGQETRKRILRIAKKLNYQSNIIARSLVIATKKFLCMKTLPTAIFAENNYMALGVWEAFLDSGLKITENMALVGFDDIASTALRGIEITTVSQKKYEMGALAVKILIDKIKNGTPAGVNQIILE